MIRKTISMPDEMGEWISQHITGNYNNESEYFRTLIRRDQREQEAISQLEQLLDEGRKSGISDKQIPDIMRDVEERLQKNGQLPPK